MMKPLTPSPSQQSGVGLIEVMVAVVVLSVGLLGIAALQAVTLKNSGSSASRTQASIQVYSMLDIIRADRANVANYNTNTYTDGPGDGAPGTLNGWLDGLPNAIGAGAQGRVICNAGSLVCRVAVRWDDSRATSAPGANPAPLEFEVTSQL